VFPRFMSQVDNDNKKRILKPAARAGGRTVPSHNLSCTARHSYLGTQLKGKACHHTPKQLWNQIHVHIASHCSLNFAAAVRATKVRGASQPSGGIGRWRRAVESGRLQSRIKVTDMCIRCREFSDVHVSKIGQARSLHLPMQNRPTALQPFCVSIMVKCRVWPSLGFVVS
jgi:hypothetical protein